ncbi:hypothetical protein FCL47_18850 [Desulfopila sp. IMCC35006]|uniref:hypothetical protein n=1 Tax=Desulfopila sp. IMCC35006 TaxID=2569542 RepID=UPI0010AD9206|nr:hypothetical protein [Desulfopila sp. IMCC35006]TKB24245.1 hypothetical protein FCL47_18850 [Desulfopila sp. IMCC35006]
MKYAFIALIAIYLIIYGCSPDSAEKAKKDHKETVETTVKQSHDSDKAAVAVEHQKPAVPAQKEQTEVVKTTEQPAESANQTDPILSFKVVEQAPSEQAAEPQQVVLPCGRVVAKEDIQENGPPCLKMQSPEMQETAASASAGTEQELAAALQQMVKTTNDMVLATRQLVIATQEILNASKKAEEKQQAEQSAAGKEAAPAQQ